MKISKTTKIGILTTTCIAILIWGMNYLSGRDIFKSERIYYAQYSNVGGLAASTDITLNGFKVGYVRDIYFANDRSGNLIAKLAITKDFDLPLGTKAEIVSSDILGSRGVQLTLGKGDEYHQPYDTLLTSLEADLKAQVSEQLAPLMIKGERLLASLDSAVSNISLIFNEESRKNLTESFARINNTMKLIEGEKENIAATIQNLKKITENLNNNSEKLDIIFANVSDFSDTLTSLKLKTTITNIDAAIGNLKQISEKIDSGRGTMGKLINDPLLYHNLTSTTENLNRLVVDLRQNPKKYVKMSAFDLGKEIYITPKPESELTGEISYKVLLMSSNMAIPLSSPLFQDIDKVEEYKNGSTYNYLTGNEKSIHEIKLILNNTKYYFPDASILAFKNGKEIRLKKALKETSN